MIHREALKLLVIFLLYLTFQVALCAEFDVSMLGDDRGERERIRRDEGNDHLDEVRAAGGVEEKDIKEFPYIAAVYRKNYTQKSHEVLCTGILLNATHVLTSAKCATIMPNSSLIEVRLGSVKSSKGGVARNVTKVTEHPNYKSDDPSYAASVYNVAVLELDVPVRKRSGVGYAHIGSHDDGAGHRLEDLVERNAMCSSAGFGLTSLHRQDAGTLRSVNMSLYPWTECNHIYMGAVEKMAQVCATVLSSVTHDRAGTCFYDDGGPLSCEGKVYGMYIFSGLSKDCGQLPDTFVRLDFLASFLESPSLEGMTATPTFPTYTQVPFTLSTSSQDDDDDEDEDEDEDDDIPVVYPICQSFRIATANNPCPLPCGAPPHAFI